MKNKTLKGTKVKIKSKISAVAILVMLYAMSVFPSTLYKYEGNCDSLEVLKLYSLFRIS
jgi:hypothetical protein